MNNEEQRQVSEVILACILLSVGGKIAVDALDAMTLTKLLEAGLWHVDGNETPDGKFTFQLVDATGRPVDVARFREIKKAAAKAAGMDSAGEQNATH